MNRFLDLVADVDDDEEEDAGAARGKKRQRVRSLVLILNVTNPLTRDINVLQSTVSLMLKPR